MVYVPIVVITQVIVGVQMFEEDEDCCDIWPKIAKRFDWMHFSEQPEMLTMPHLNTGDNKWFVNFCPACGKEARNRKMLKKRLFNE